MARLQSPDGQQTISIRAGSPLFWTYYRAGWVDITKPSTDKQSAQRRKWREKGDIAYTIAVLNRQLTNSLLSSTETDRISDLIETLEFRLQKINATPEKRNG